jgi:hypothetical protein
MAIGGNKSLLYFISSFSFLIRIRLTKNPMNNLEKFNMIQGLKKLSLTIIIFLSNGALLSQNYDYAKFFAEKKLEGKILLSKKKNNFDSVDYYLSKYENRLGYFYHYYKALVENHKGSAVQMKYLDTAFRKGMAIHCMGDDYSLFNSDAVYKSHALNFLKDYDEDYILQLQRMDYQDQKYRPTINAYVNKPESKKEQKKKDIDSLWSLQNKLDSINFRRLKQLISEKGWPSAKLIGITQCDGYKAPLPDVLVIHMGIGERKYQVEILKRVIQLCLTNEESWHTAEFMVFNIYQRSRRQFNEFLLLETENNKVNEEKSFFALYQMSETLIKKPAEIIELKCKDVALFNDIERCMLKVNTQIQISGLQDLYAELGRTRPEHLNESRFRFIEDKELEENAVLFRYVEQ